MSEETATISEPTIPQTASTSLRKRSIWRFFRRAAAILFFLIIILIAFTQTDLFRSFLRSQVTSLVESNTNGTISIGEIGGNFLTGISLNTVALRLKSDTVPIARIRSASVRFSLWDLVFSKNITVNSVSLNEAAIFLTKRSGDTLWNYERFLKAAAPSAAPSKPFSMTIALQNLSVNSSSLRVTDENDTSSVRMMADGKKRYIHWSDLDIRNISLSASGRVESGSQQYLKIDHLSLDEMNSPFHLYELSFTAYRDRSNVEVKNLRVLTDETKLTLDASVSPLVMLAGKPYDSLGKAHTQVKLLATRIGQSELAQFIPDISFLSGIPSLDFEADGEYGKLKIKRGRLGLGTDGSVNFSGEVLNLHRPEQLYLDVDLTGRNLSDRTLRNYLPGLNLPDLRQYGTINIPKLAYDGTPAKFSTELEINTSNGSIKGKVDFDLTKKQPVYAANVATESLNAAPLLGDSSLSSDLNIQIHINGSGFDPKTMNATASVDGTNTSHIYGFDISGMHLAVNVGKGIVQTDKSSIAFADGSHVESDYASLDLHSKQPAFESDFSATGIPISRFVRQFPSASRVSTRAAINGEIGSPKSLKGSFQATVSGLPYHGQPLGPVSISATLDHDDSTGERTDVISSDIADLTIKGIYNFQTLGAALADRFSALIHSFDIRKTDSLSAAVIHSNETMECKDSLHCEYSLKMKDLRALDHFLAGTTLLAKGKMKGEITGCPERMMNISLAGSLDHVLVAPRVSAENSKSSVPKIIAKKINVDIALNELSTHPQDILERATGRVNISSDSVLKVVGIGIESPTISVSLASDLVRFDVGGSIEGKTGLRLKGNGTVSGPVKSLSIDTARIKFSDGFEWSNDRPSTLTITSSGEATLDTLSLFRPEPSFDPGNNFAQRLKLCFGLKGDSIQYASVTSPMLRVPDLPRFVSPWTGTTSAYLTNGRLSRLNVTLSGTLSHPIAHADFSVRSLTYNSVTIDTAMAAFDYRDGIVHGSANAHVDSDAFRIESMRTGKEIVIPAASNGMHLSIDSLPYLVSLADYPERSADSARIASTPVSIRLDSRDYPIDMFSPFIPVITDVHGLSSVSLAIRGLRDSLQFGGTATISKGSFLVPYTNIRYSFSGPISLAHSELTFDGVTVANYASDLENASGILTGGFHFSGFNVDRFKLALAVPSQLLILNDASKETMKTIYGPLVIRTSEKPLVFYGTVDEPHLDGEATITQAFLTFPQTVSSAAELQNDGIRYILAGSDISDDTLHTDIDSAFIPKPPTRDPEEIAFAVETEPTTPSAAPKQEDPDLSNILSGDQLSFMDKMLYNLSIKVPGDCWLNISFNKAYGFLGQQLKAELKSDGVWYITRDRQGVSYNSYGTLRLTDKSSYKFISKEFSPVKGTITFNKSFDNPSLDLSAEYVGSYSDGEAKVVIKITGTRYDPRLAFELYKKVKGANQFEADPHPADQVQNDIFFYLGTGVFPNESGASTALNNLSNSGASLGSQYVSSMLNNVLASTSLKNYVRSLGVEYGGAATGAKLYGTVGYKDFVIHAGTGQNSIGTYSSDFSVEFPLSTIWSFTGSDNLLTRIEGHYNDINQSLGQRPTYLGRLMYRFSLSK